MKKFKGQLALNPKSISSILFVFAVQLVHINAAQAQLKLDEAVKEASANSLVIQRSKAGYEEAQWKKAEAYSGFLPSVTASVNYLTDKKYMVLDTAIGGNPVSVPQVIPTTLYTLKASMPLFDGFSSTQRLRSSYAFQDAAQNEYEWTQFSVERQAILQYYKTLATSVLKDVAEQNLKTLDDHLKDTKAYKKAGVVTNYDVLRVEVQVSEAQSELLNAQDNVEMAKYKLGEVLGKEIETRTLSGELPVVLDAVLKKVENLSLENRKDILALKDKQDAAELLYSSANKYWVPRLSVFGEVNYYNNRTDGFDDSENFRNAYNVGLNLTWNLFDGMNSIARSGQTEQQALQVQKSARIAEIKAKQDYEFWKRKLNYFISVYKARVNDVARSQESVRLSKEGRKAGINTSTNLLDAESDLFRSKAGQVNAQIGAIEALINLELASGQKLFNFN